MLNLVVNWFVRPIVATIIGQACIQAFHLMGFFPDRWLAGVLASMIEEPPLYLLDTARWILAAAIGVVLLLVWHWWQSHKKPSLTTPATTPDEKPSKLPSSTSYLSILAEEKAGEQLPTRHPDDGNFWLLSPWFGARAIGGLQRSFGPAHTAREWHCEWAWKCEIKNHGALPLFNLKIPVSIVFQDVIRTEKDKGGSGATLK